MLVIRHRPHAEARARYDLGPVRVSYRARYQVEIRGSIADELRYTVRNRLQAALELFYRVEVLQNDPDDPIPHIFGIAYDYELWSPGPDGLLASAA